ncbi:hypothetical protein [Lichenifustis flavocetrariae]|uniref:Invasion associated locus B family protein n=1 Tax=Lichenifustis flavocetrariae TaxID=2949735 RepID=A0AA41Z050_9HYPH|nr:hypothetical protein [Lichenifustis flavocetrariae]MCW6508035.1 hypothetical protein [Lichenifustis flavocetrariae]
MKRMIKQFRLCRPGSTLTCALVVLAPLIATGATSSAFAQGQGAAALKKAAANSGHTVIKTASRRKAAATAPVSAKPTLVGTFGDWGVYVSQGPKSKVCYALGQPSARAPASMKKDAAYIFISNRPGEGVHNEVSIMTGVPLKEGAAGAKAEIGSTGYDLVAKGQNAFVKNAAEEGQFVGTLKRRGARLVVKLLSARSGTVTDTYSLSGVQQALDRVAKECP